MSDKMLVTPDSNDVRAEEYCKEFNIRTQAEAEKALSNAETLYRQSARFYGDYGDNPELDVHYNQADADFEAQAFKKTAQDTVEKFKRGEFPKEEWEKEKDDDDHPKPNAALPQKPRDDSPTGEGNTIGSIVGQAPQSASPPHAANPAIKPEAPAEKGMWDKTVDWFQETADDFNKWVDESKHNLQAAWDSPGEAAVGAGKALWNTVPEMGELLGKGAVIMTTAPAVAAEKAWEYMGGSPVGVSELQQKAVDMVNADAIKMEMKSDAEKGGDLIFTGFSFATGFGGLIKGAAKGAAKTAAKTESKVLAEEARAAEAAGAKIKGQSPETANPAPAKPKNTEKDPVDNKSTDKDGSCNGTCSTKSEPVDMATGDFLQVWPVIAIPGLLPITLTRTYRSTAKLNGLFGPKWADDWSRQLVLTDGKINFTDADGVIYDFNTPDNTVLARNQRIPHYLLTGELTGELQLTDRQSQLSYHFNHIVGNIRKLSAITDRRQNAIRFIYNKHSQLIEVTRTDGFRLILGYQDQQLQTVDYLKQQTHQRLVTCHYDSQGYLHQCDAFQHNHLWHEYDAQGRMTRWHDTDQTDLYLIYDEQGRVVSMMSPSGYWSDRFHYDDQARITTYRDAEGGETQHHYDHNGLVIREVDPLGRVIRRQWRYSQIVWEADAAGGITTFDYNPDGALTEMVLPTGETFAYGYDEHGQLIESVLPTGERWQFHYDEQGNLTALTNPLGHKEEYQYGTHGELRQRLLPDGRQWHYAYDEQQRLAAVMTPDGQTTGLQLDELGRLRQ
uniref:RHS repeat domain-containing protein n=1 Tax=Xenorhabdus sp. NBAII XenSa04 TaxID=1429873 RepID=UPI001E38CD1F